MPFAIRGVLEGFYGRLWSWAERDRMVDFMSEQGYNLYLYSPKNDPIHRNRWREPYLPEEIRRFGALARRCREQGIEFVMGISPLKYHYSDPADFAVIWSKVNAFWQVGIRSFSLLLDDMPDRFHFPDDDEQFGNVAAGQVWLNNLLLDRLKTLGEVGNFIFTPTEYHGEGVSPYLETLGRELSPEIDVFWTGREICSPVLLTADARRVSASLQRPVLYWDNYPVNDLDMWPDPHLRPIQGREGDLDTACRGIVVNAALQPEAAKIPLHTYAQYLADPAGYEPEAAWSRALEAVAGNPADAAAVRILGDLSRRSALEKGRQLDNFLLPRLERFWRQWGGVPAAAGPDLPDLPDRTAKAGAPDAPAAAGRGEVAGVRAAAVAEIAGAFDELRQAAQRLLGQMENPFLKADLLPWSRKLEGWAGTGTLAVDVLRRALANPNDPALPALREEMLDRLWATRENFHWLAGDMVDQFARRCLWAAEEASASSLANPTGSSTRRHA